MTRSAAELDDSRPPFQGNTGIGTRALSPHQRADTNLRRYLLILGQLGVLIALVYRFQLETESFRQLLLLTAGGFAVHYFLPLRYRLWFFVLLSFAGIGMVLGPVEGAWLVGIGLAVIGVCHLPISLIARAAILCVAAIGMAVLRIGVGQVPWSSALWPILGSMFVFRLIIYFYDRSYETTPPRLSQTLGYFFLLPNVCFPLFPVVDFKKFCRHYYDEDRHKTYQVGIEWIWRGLLQLVLYRLIYYHLTLDPVAVSTFGRPRRLYGVDVPAVRAHLRPFSSRHRHASPVRIQPARNPSQVFAGVELHRLLEADQYLLEGLHDEGLLLSRLLSPP